MVAHASVLMSMSRSGGCNKHYDMISMLLNGYKLLNTNLEMLKAWKETRERSV